LNLYTLTPKKELGFMSLIGSNFDLSSVDDTSKLTQSWLDGPPKKLAARAEGLPSLSLSESSADSLTHHLTHTPTPKTELGRLSLMSNYFDLRHASKLSEAIPTGSLSGPEAS